MLTDLRLQLTALMAAAQPLRKPALRRASAPQWLLSSDLPQLLPLGSLRAFKEAARRADWRMEEADGWLYFDHPLPLPPSSPEPLLSGEAACVASLLRRHPSDVMDEDALRALAKAAEQGGAPLEAYCHQLHMRCATLLRCHQPLPARLLPYLLAAYATKHS